MSQKLLTSLELKVMNLLWNKEQAFVKELIEAWEEIPKPAYNTISTVVRILEEKSFVDHKSEGRSYKYFPTVSREEYQKRHIKNVLTNVFSGSVSNMISSLVGQEDLSADELDGLRKMIDGYEE